MSLLQLPNELLHQIAEELWLPDLLDFTLTCCRLKTVCFNRLTEHIRLRMKYCIFANAYIKSMRVRGPKKLSGDAVQPVSTHKNFPSLFKHWYDLHLDNAYTYVTSLTVERPSWWASPSRISRFFEESHLSAFKECIRASASCLSRRPSQTLLDELYLLTEQAVQGDVRALCLAIIPLMPNLRHLTLKAMQLTEIALFDRITACIPVRALSRLTTIECRYVGSVDMRTFMGMLSLPSLRTVYFSKSEFHPTRAKLLDWPANLPLSNVEKIYFDQSYIPKRFVQKIAQGIKGPCKVRIFWDEIAQLWFGNYGQHESEWDTCIIPAERHGVEDIAFSLRGRLHMQVKALTL